MELGKFDPPWAKSSVLNARRAKDEYDELEVRQGITHIGPFNLFDEGMKIWVCQRHRHYTRHCLPMVMVEKHGWPGPVRCPYTITARTLLVTASGILCTWQAGKGWYHLPLQQKHGRSTAPAETLAREYYVICFHGS